LKKQAQGNSDLAGIPDRNSRGSTSAANAAARLGPNLIARRQR